MIDNIDALFLLLVVVLAAPSIAFFLAKMK